jgi:hypothetical protein
MRRPNLFQSHVLRKSNDLSDAKGCYCYGQDYLLSLENVITKALPPARNIMDTTAPIHTRIKMGGFAWMTP